MMKEQLDCSSDNSSNSSKTLGPFSLTLNHGETFGIFDRHGNVTNCEESLQGVFFEGARHLSKYEFKVNGKDLLLLSSTVREDNDVLISDLTNEEFFLDGIKIPYGTIYVKRSKRIQNNQMLEKLRFYNYNRFSIKVICSLTVESDFRDVFELRGFVCDKKSCPISNRSTGDYLRLEAIGRDDVLRRTTTRCKNAQSRLTEDTITVELKISENEHTELSISTIFEQKTKGQKPKEENQSQRLGQHELPKFKSNNSHFDHWIKRSSVDLMALMAKYDDVLYPMAGVPWYNTPFGRDGIITAFQCLSFIPQISKSVLKYLAANQATGHEQHSDSHPGKIMHEMRKGELANIGALPFKKYYGAADSTFLFIWLLGLYCKRSGDIEFLDEVWGPFQKCLEWIDKYADQDGDGFYEYKKENPQGLDNQCWKDSFDSISHIDGELAMAPIAVVEVQAYAYKAMLAASYLFRLKSDEERAKLYDKKAKTLKQKVNEVFWMEEEEFFCLALDSHKKKCRVISSNGGHILATGVVEKNKAKKVVEKLFSPDMFSGWGIRTLSASEARFNPMSYHNGSIWPHDNSMIAYGLKRYGEIEKFNILTTSLFELSQEVNLSRLPELFCGFEREESESPTLYPVSCAPQAWAAGVVFLLVHSMLGLSVNGLEKKVTFNNPTLPEFLVYLRIDELRVEEGAFSFIIKRISNFESTVEVLKRARGWKVSINK